ncbi:glutathione S-transferase [Brevundimonas aveniformis]|uniref:glutathione S-transferase n=1 Tax=Brevundimonas aveniformis TaxID=370977 RepID=UPI0024903F15|nr:glutathione S-transferase [Brevundimonas aveniformis]
MIIVHHLNDSRSQRVLWLLEELGLDYEIRAYRRDPHTMLAPTELKSVHPLGKSPVIEDNGIKVAETGAIFDYLLNTYGDGRLRPAPGTEDARRFTYWMYYAEGSAMTPLLLRLIFAQIPARVPFLARPVANSITKAMNKRMIQPQLDGHIGFWEAELGRDEWFAGPEFTAADIMMSFPLEAAAARAGAARKPKIAAFLQRIHGREAYQRAITRGGPYSYA